MHASHRQLIYQGMHEDLKARGRDLQTDSDVAEMQCYWVKMGIHREVDALREDCAARGAELPMELEVEGGLVEGEEQSLTLEAELEAASVVRAWGTEDQGEQKMRSGRQGRLKLRIGTATREMGRELNI